MSFKELYNNCMPTYWKKWQDYLITKDYGRTSFKKYFRLIWPFEHELRRTSISYCIKKLSITAYTIHIQLYLLSEIIQSLTFIDSRYVSLVLPLLHLVYQSFRCHGHKATKSKWSTWLSGPRARRTTESS